MQAGSSLISLTPVDSYFHNVAHLYGPLYVDNRHHVNKPLQFKPLQTHFISYIVKLGFSGVLVPYFCILRITGVFEWRVVLNLVYFSELDSYRKISKRAAT